MKHLNILIVEDEILIAELIKAYLEEDGHSVADIAISYDEAVSCYNQYKPDLILLDIRLYGLQSGVDFARYLESIQIEIPVVFLSSQYDERTLSQALETHPYGYLTKPVSKESLRTTVITAYRLFESRHNEKEIQLFDGKSHHLVNPNDILYVEADHIYVNVVLRSEKVFTIRATLKNILSQLPPEKFIQCHRSFIVNRKHIKSWNTTDVVMDNGKKISVSRNFKDGINTSFFNTDSDL